MREIFTTGRFDKRLTAFIHRHPELKAETAVLPSVQRDIPVLTGSAFGL